MAHQVPLLIISLSSLQSPISSDLTLNRILPYIDGINSISRIAQLADTDLSLTRRAIQHLVYYGCLVLLDIFSFGAIYACTAEIGGFVVDEDVKAECARYVRVPRMRLGSDARTIRLGSESSTSHYNNERDSISSSASHPSDNAGSTLKPPDFEPQMSSPQNNTESGSDPDEFQIDHFTLILLYTSLRQGLTLKNWVLDHLPLLRGIDVRRLITFGVIKGFLYRVHKYAIATSSTGMPPAPPTSLQTSAAPSIANTWEGDGGTVRGGAGGAGRVGHAQHPSFSLHRPSIASTTSINPQHLAHHPRTLSISHPPLPLSQHQHHQPHNDPSTPAFDSSEHDTRENGLPLLRFLDGMHCFDEICTELALPERVVEGKVRGLGEGTGVVVMR